MKCNHCQAEWTVPAAVAASIKSCPFCGVPFTTISDDSLTSMVSTIKAIIQHIGIDGLRDGKRALAMFSDLAPQLKRERVMFSYFVQCHGNVSLLDSLTKSSTEQAFCKNKISQQMMQEFLISEDIANEAYDSFLLAVNDNPSIVAGSAEQRIVSPLSASTAVSKTAPLNKASPQRLVSKKTLDFEACTIARPSIQSDTLDIWDEISSLSNKKTIIECVISEQTKFGLIATYKGIRIFIPTSQSGVTNSESIPTMVGTAVQLIITEINRERHRAIGSIRAATTATRKAAQAKIWAEIKIGNKYRGVITSMTSYGVFVDIGGVEGMVHISDLSWSHIKSPDEVVSVGDEIDVYVISIDPEKQRISFGHKTAEMNPWNHLVSTYKIGEIVEAQIVKVMAFGAFAQLLPGVDGLIHISQMGSKRIGHPSDIISEGQHVKVQILSIDVENKRLMLSLIQT